MGYTFLTAVDTKVDDESKNKIFCSIMRLAWFPTVVDNWSRALLRGLLLKKKKENRGKGQGALPEEFGGAGSEFEDAAGQSLALHERRRVGQLVALQVAARDAHGARRFARRDDDAHARVTAAPHRSAAGVHHEADQEPAPKQRHTASSSTGSSSSAPTPPSSSAALHIWCSSLSTYKKKPFWVLFFLLCFFLYVEILVSTSHRWSAGTQTEDARFCLRWTRTPVSAGSGEAQNQRWPIENEKKLMRMKTKKSARLVTDNEGMKKNKEKTIEGGGVRRG